MEDASRGWNVGRKTPSLGAHIFFGERNIFFVTVNAKDRIPWIAQSAVHESLILLWKMKATAWFVGNYVLMPDHIHFFCAPHDLHFTIDDWISFWKSQFRRSHLDQPWEFQRRAFHHRIRNGDDYAEKWSYLKENPVRGGLVKRSEDWSFQGVVHPEVHW